ncbi:beta-1,3-glucanase, putative [Medicago truncatula]|uniref:Beta-1,3-glucanase, putative n=1 Tax=Medicago truncatula TaxID=3880 RepID=G7KKQ0_MEDTR|nr:beta-1,3-glucanase, putative [Medicago truncatula]
MEYIDPSKSPAWIQHHVQPYLSETKITCITLGNEVFNSNETQPMLNLLPSMQKCAWFVIEPRNSR